MNDETHPIISLPSWVLLLNLIIALLVFLGVGMLYEEGSDLRTQRLQVAGLLLLTLGVASLLVRRIGNLWRAARAASHQLIELNESLEERVAERTRELAAVNADLGRSKLITEEQNNGRRELLHVLCHDLANPLTCIQESVRQLQVNREQWGLLFPILSLSSQNAVDVIELVRQIQVIEDRPMDLYTVNLRYAAESAATMLRGHLERKRVTLEIDMDASLQVIAEPTSLVSSVLSNILTNAIKFSLSGEKVLLQATTRSGQVYIRCIDHGIGMSETIRQNLFHVGKNISRVGTAGETGTGFGMPMVKKFVTAYGGTVEVQSVDAATAPTRGSTVLVVLPRAKAVETQPPVLQNGHTAEGQR